MRKKIISILMALLVLFLLASCGHGVVHDLVDNDQDLKDISVPDTDRKIIITARYEIETKNLANTIESFTDLITQVEGYIENSSIREKSAAFVFRVPIKNLQTFTDFTKESGKVTYTSQQGKDVTIEYYDTESELNALRVQEGRLLDLLEKAENLDNILKLEEQLTNIRVRIEKLTTRLNELNNLISYATVQVDLEEVESLDTGFIPLVKNSFKSSINFALNILKALIICLVWLLPLIVPAGIIILIILLIRKKNQKSKE